MEETMIEKIFNYHAPTPEQMSAMTLVRLAAINLANTIDRQCPPSADRTAAIRKLVEVSMTANHAIMMNGEGYR